MTDATPWYKRTSRATFENVGLFLFSLVLYCYHLNTIPEKLELFEEWVNNYLPILAKPWTEMYRDFAQVGHNDTICAVNTPIWLVLVQGSISLFGKIPFAYRLPAVLLTIFTPVLTAEFIRRYLRKDLALLVGLVVATHQHIMWFGRTGGYVGPTLTLLMASLLCAGMIVFENRRRSWIGLALCLAVLPYFYSTIRYYIAVPLGLIAYQFLMSREFRARNVLPLLATIIFLVVTFIPLTQHGIKTAMLMFISGRGEQVLITEKNVTQGFESEAIEKKYRLSGIIHEIIPERLVDLRTIYTNGTRFFNSRHQHLHFDTVWIRIRPWILIGIGLGVLSCLWKARTRRRYLIPVVWSTWAWIPLLVTTGISPNRLFLGVPSDVILLVFGIFVPIEVAERFLPAVVVKGLRIVAWSLLGLLCCYSATTYYLDYRIAPHM